MSGDHSFWTIPIQPTWVFRWHLYFRSSKSLQKHGSNPPDFLIKCIFLHQNPSKSNASCSTSSNPPRWKHHSEVNHRLAPCLWEGGAQLPFLATRGTGKWWKNMGSTWVVLTCSEDVLKLPSSIFSRMNCPDKLRMSVQQLLKLRNFTIIQPVVPSPEHVKTENTDHTTLVLGWRFRNDQ